MNYRDTCPHHRDQHTIRELRPEEIPDHSVPGSFQEQHAHWSPPPGDGSHFPGERAPAPRLAELPGIAELIPVATDTYGLSTQQVLKELHLTRTLFMLREVLGEHLVMARPYTTRQIPAGQFVFRGGTSLVSAWDVCERYSVDLDLLFGNWWGLSRQQARRALARVPVGFMNGFGARGVKASTTNSNVAFFALQPLDFDGGLDVDVAAMPEYPAPLWIEPRKVVSLLGRLASQETLNEYPFLGGFRVPTLGPGSTAMDKLLAQAGVAAERTTDGIAYRVRDWYDLGRIGQEKDRFEGHIGRDSRALLGISEWWSELVGAPERRPSGGFKSLPTVRKGTPEYRALEDGYRVMHSEYVWGEPMVLDDAIELGLSLDPGPAEPFEPA